MAIIGITHDADGRVKQSLAVTTKVAIGLGPDEQAGRKAPTKLDHFVFLRKDQVGAGNKAEIRWVKDEELTQHYGENPREIGIVLLDDDIENLFPSEYAWWTRAEKVCWGDGASATRRTKEHPEGEAWPGEREVHGCGPGCPDLEAGRCKSSADFYFLLEDFPALGRVCRTHTSSYRSIRQIHSALNQIRQITGGRLTGIHAKLCVHPEKASYTDDRDGGKRKSTTIWALSLELDAETFRKMIDKMTETARLFDSTRKLLGGQVIEYRELEEPEEEKATEIQPEFYPENGEPPPETEPEITPERAELINRIKRAGKRVGLNDAQIQFEIGRHWEDLDAYLAELSAQGGAEKGKEATEENKTRPETVSHQPRGRTPTPINSPSAPPSPNPPARGAGKKAQPKADAPRALKTKAPEFAW